MTRVYILCAACETPVAEVQFIGGTPTLLIVSRHHGQHHETLVPLALVQDLPRHFPSGGGAVRGEVEVGE